jgi:hypothetical protein
MSIFLPRLESGWHVDQAILAEESRVVVIRFGHDYEPDCMRHDETLYGIAEKVKNMAVICACPFQPDRYVWLLTGTRPQTRSTSPPCPISTRWRSASDSDSLRGLTRSYTPADVRAVRHVHDHVSQRVRSSGREADNPVADLPARRFAQVLLPQQAHHDREKQAHAAQDETNKRKKLNMSRIAQ